MSSNVNKKAARKAKRQEEENAKRLLDEKIAAQERRDVKTRIIVAVVSVVILLVGIREEVAEASIKSDYSTWLDAVTKYIPKRPSLANVSGKYKGQMTTPTVTVNKKFVDLNKASEDNISLEEALLKSLGITKKNVGKAAVIPSVGASGAPLELKK